MISGMIWHDRGMILCITLVFYENIDWNIRVLVPSATGGPHDLWVF